MSIKERLSELRHETVEVRGESVTVRELTAGQRVELLEAFRENAAAAMFLVCAMTARDENGLIWTREEAAELPPDVVDSIANAALNLSGMGASIPNE